MTMRKTVANLTTVMMQLDDACGSLDNALMNLSSMKGLPSDIVGKIERMDLDAIVSLKNSVEELLEEKSRPKEGKNNVS